MLRAEPDPEDVRRLAVVGHPVEHSLSPAIHSAAYAALGLPWSYERIDIEPGGLAAFVDGLDASWRGLSVTMPHKQDAARLGEPDEPVRLTGVANTIVLEAVGRRVHNTDVSGFGIALAAHGVRAPDRAVIVGNGATALSALVAVHRMGTRDGVVVCREPARAAGVGQLAERLGMRLGVQRFGERLEEADVLISTIPTDGVAPHVGALVDAASVVFDSVYDPWPTPLGLAAQNRGRMVLNGLDLLAGQAVDQVRWFTGHPIDFESARATARNALEARTRV